PNGPYEPRTFLALLFGGTVTEIIRRYVPQPQEPVHLPQLGELKSQVEELLRLFRSSHATEADNHLTDTAEPSLAPAEPEPRDELRERIRSLLESRSVLSHM